MSSKHHHVICISPLVSIATIIFIWQCSYFENITLLLLSCVHSPGQPFKGSWVFLMLLFCFVFYMDILKFGSFFLFTHCAASPGFLVSEIRVNVSTLSWNHSSDCLYTCPPLLPSPPPPRNSIFSKQNSLSFII